MRLLIAGYGLLAAAALSSCTIQSAPTDEERARAFQPHVDGYLDATGLTEDLDAGAYLKGKVLPIYTDTRTAAVGLLTYLPAEIRAKTPDEVGTIVWLEWGEERGQSYQVESSGAVLGGLVPTCTITVIDRAARKIVGRTKVVADQSPTTRVAAGDAAAGGQVVSERPTAKVLQYLEALPRR